MFIKIIKSNQPAVLIFLIIICSLLWIKTFIFQDITELSPENIRMPLYDLFYTLLSKNKIILISSGLLILIIQSLYLARLNYKYIFLEGRTYITSVIFILISGSVLELQWFHPAIPGSLALTFAIDKIFYSYRKEKALSLFFDASFIISVGSLFYFNIIYFMIIVWVSLIILRTFNWREWFVTITGLITPYILVCSYYYIFDDIVYVKDMLFSNLHSCSIEISTDITYIIYFAFLLLLVIISIFSMFSKLGLKKVSTRKYFSIIFWVFLFSLVFTLLLPSMFIDGLVIIAVPASYIISSYFISMRSKWWGDIFLLIWIGLLIYIQVVK